MIGFAAKRLMELEVGAATGAGYGEKSAERLAQRNACRSCRVPEVLTPTGGDDQLLGMCGPSKGAHWRYCCPSPPLSVVNFPAM